MQFAHSTIATAWAGKWDHKNPPSAPPAIPPIIITPFSRQVIPMPDIDPRAELPGPPIEPPPLPGLRI
ncbi:hypothetical protein HH212_05425 [Massilia forsythiae]|uniref:Uncharacterized protein n=1 Tax=Massilia forsythiae TaxID=2728020 RepID=A0A7Z2ZRJ2_9BURK|nr:hypothetical protein [Massilia forsythiae]QJD99530.1 hypothetical protein HH212_05425 [Massilia forsythiae]